jgi:hypothetical protein
VDWVFAQNVLIPLAGMATGTIAMVGLFRVVIRWIDRRHELKMAELRGGSDATNGLRARVEALEEVAYRLQEVEERLEFAERLLARRRAQELSPGD